MILALFLFTLVLGIIRGGFFGGRSRLAAGFSFAQLFLQRADLVFQLIKSLVLSLHGFIQIIDELLLKRQGHFDFDQSSVQPVEMQIIGHEI